MRERFVQAWHDGKSDTDTFEFESPKALFSVLTPKRWELIERLQALGEISLRGLARSLARDVKRVHEDVAILLEWGLVQRTPEGKIHVPYEKIHTEFDLLAAA
ncbi:MAG: transcriptional regulator [Paraburkholderia sp.]|nr:MAG: transcriptional regulator [Paraburkholderia sp.]